VTLCVTKSQIRTHFAQ